MHDDQVDVDVDVVRVLLAEQQPDLAGLPITRVVSTGTVNGLFRIGDDLVARLPLRDHWEEGIDREWRWIPWLASRITSVRLPEPVFKGKANDAFPFTWSVYRWIEGAPYDDALIDDEAEAAMTLARFVLELRSLDVTPSAPVGGRDPLKELDEDTREAIQSSAGVIDASAAMTVWDQAVRTPAWDGASVWIHGDLLRPNLLVHEGQLDAVIDYGYIGVGDPATDLIPAWAVFGPAGRAAFREMVEPDDISWARGRGIALHQAAMIIPYYTVTNPAFVELARRTVDQILEDADL
jgi:aminoglycoside phosphotransferase (APT) family kinase protein